MEASRSFAAPNEVQKITGIGRKDGGEKTRGRVSATQPMSEYVSPRQAEGVEKEMRNNRYRDNAAINAKNGADPEQSRDALRRWRAREG
ncbi:hypothetical protein K0M31_013513 [Melipona bicolor]|uniref:Uncharacterized protein n=1 Tax=Melipona bicolor TaxID=60889 RepID=A0AA40FHU0_9HYME|nr:hypothetical protein K0M31_013513 [Melipona bicolor]